MNYKNKNRNKNDFGKTYSVVGSVDGNFHFDDNCPHCRQMRLEISDGRIKKVKHESGFEVYEIIEN